MTLQQTTVLLVAVMILPLSGGAPVVNDKLPLKTAENGICDWGCDSKVDKKFEMCETMCTIDSQSNNKLYQEDIKCQEVCASKYVICLQECSKTLNTVLP